jgi:hypothetical protein
VAKRQAMYDGAVGARAMHKLQNYGADELVYDNMAYSFSSTYQDGRLQIYSTHPTKPLTPGGQPEYHMTKTKGFDMTSDRETFVKGATAYRDNRDLAMTYRDSFIEQANERARQMPISSSTTTFSDSRASLSPLIVGSDTSEDELARNEVTPVKRPRPTPMPLNSHEATTRRSSRSTSSSTPQRSAAADLTPLDNQRSLTVTGPGTCPSTNQVQTLQNAIEVPSKRMRHEGVLGWCIRHKSKSVFVPDSQWTSLKKDGRKALFCDRLDVFTYQSGSR